MNTVRFALKTFEEFGMIEVVDNVITITNWNKHQTLDAYEKKRNVTGYISRTEERSIRT